MKKLLPLLLLFALTAKAQLYHQDTTFRMGSLFDTVAALPAQALLAGDDHLFLERAGNLINGKPNNLGRVVLLLNRPETPPVMLPPERNEEYAVWANLRTKSFIYQRKQMYEGDVGYFKIDRLHADGSRDTTFNLPKTRGSAFRLFEGPDNELFVLVNPDNNGLELYHFAANGDFKRLIKFKFEGSQSENAIIGSVLFNEKRQLYFRIGEPNTGKQKLIRTEYDLSNRRELSEVQFDSDYGDVLLENQGKLYYFSYKATPVEQPTKDYYEKWQGKLSVFDADGKRLLLKEIDLRDPVTYSTVSLTKITDNGELHIASGNRWLRLSLDGEVLETPASETVAILDSYANGDFLISDNGDLFRYVTATAERIPLNISLKSKREFFPAKVFVQANGNKMVTYSQTQQSAGTIIYSYGSNWVKIYDTNGKTLYEFKAKYQPVYNYEDREVYLTEKTDGYFRISELFGKNVWIVDSLGNLKTLPLPTNDLYQISYYTDKKDLLVFQTEGEPNADLRNFRFQRIDANGATQATFSLAFRSNEGVSHIYFKDKQEIVFYRLLIGFEISVNEILRVNALTGELIENISDAEDFNRYEQLYKKSINTQLRPPKPDTGYFISSVYVGEFGNYQQTLTKVREDLWPDTAFGEVKMWGGEVLRVHNDGLLTSAASVSNWNKFYNILKLTPAGQPDSTLVWDSKWPVMHFDFNAIDTIYAVANNKVLRFYASPLTGEEVTKNEEFNVVTDMPPQAPWNQLRAFYFNIEGDKSRLKITAPPGVTFTEETVTLPPTVGNYEIHIVDTVTQQTYTQKLAITKATPKFTATTYLQNANRWVEVASSAGSEVQIIFQGKRYYGAVSFPQSVDAGLLLFSPENAKYFAGEELLVVDSGVNVIAGIPDTNIPETVAKLLPYPNPAKGRVYLPIAAGEYITNAELVQVNGAVMPMKYNVDNQVVVIDLPISLKGKYFLRVTDATGKSHSHALIIQ